MDTLCITQLNESRDPLPTCLYCMTVIMETEKTWVTKNGNHFCCWECVEEHDKKLHSY